MPGKVDKKSVTADAVMVEGVNLTALDQEGLMNLLIQQAKTLQTAKKERLFAEEERDLFFRQLETARDALQQQEAALLLKRKSLQDVKDKQHMELKIYRQRASHLKYEMDKEAQAEQEHQQALAQETVKQRISDRAEIAREVMYRQRKDADEEQAFLQNMKEHALKMGVEKEEFRHNLTEAMECRFSFISEERELAEAEAERDVRMYSRKVDQERLENVHHLQVNYERNFSEVKRYFQELTYHNLAMVHTLTQQSGRVREHVQQLAGRLREVHAQNRKYRLPMQTKEAHLADLRKQVDNLNKDEAAAQRTNAEVEHLQNERDKLKKEIGHMHQQLIKLQEETKSLQGAFLTGSLEAKGILGAQANLLRGQTLALKEQVDRVKDDIRHKILTKDVDAHQLLDQVEAFERQCLENSAIRHDLQQSILKMAKVYNDSLQTIRYLVQEFNLRLDPSLDRTPLHPQGLLAGKPAEIHRLRQVKHALTRPNRTSVSNHLF